MLRVATEEDVPVIMDITQSYPVLLLQYLTREDTVRQFLPEIVVCYSAAGAGYVHFHKCRSGRLHICQIAVKSQRGGIGFALIDYLRGLSSWVTVDCSVKNLEARAFYEAIGFRESSIRTFFNKAVGRYSTFIRFGWRSYEPVCAL
jgi:ribosomal protein S18 acetylase RimI-like enzyme